MVKQVRENMSITKSELIERVVDQQKGLLARDVDLAIKTILEAMSQALSTGKRIEIRGFGSFCLHYREPRVGRNPKTGDSVKLQGKYVPHFKPGKELRDRVNLAMQHEHVLKSGMSGVAASSSLSSSAKNLQSSVMQSTQYGQPGF